jgi:cytochrome c556
MMKRTGTIAAAVLLAAGALYAAPLHPEIKDPAVYIPLREEMTRMEMRFVDAQILAAEDKVDFRAVQRALDEMERASRKIHKVITDGGLQESLQKLGTQIDGLQRDARRRDRNALKGDLDRLFETCFKCHQTHAPMM